MFIEYNAVLGKVVLWDTERTMGFQAFRQVDSNGEVWWQIFHHDREGAYEEMIMQAHRPAETPRAVWRTIWHLYRYEKED